MSLEALPSRNYQWCEKLPRISDNSRSHSRIIYISIDPSLPKWVAKIETNEIRIRRGLLLFPYAEEIAYKVCKLFHWDSVPKSKVFHQCSVQSLGSAKKINKYEPLVKCFETVKGLKTFTFQLFVEGETLPNSIPTISQKPDLASFQKIYLLWMILGKSDDRGDNVIFDAMTGKLFGIDNEYIGSKEYQKSGVLNCFEVLKEKDIDPSILEDVLKVNQEELKQIQVKYKAKEIDLLNLWSKEPVSIPLNKSASIDIQQPNLRDSSDATTESDDSEFAVNDCWGTILNNLKFLQEEIVSLKGKDEPITIEALKRGVAVAHSLSSPVDDFELQF